MIRRTNMWHELSRMHEQMDALFASAFGDFTNRPLLLSNGQKNQILAPRKPDLDMYEQDGNIIAEAELPGMDKKDIFVRIHDDAVEISAKQSHEIERDEKDMYRFERQSASFSRWVPLPEVIDSTKAKAEFKNGVLKLTMPKKDPSGSGNGRLLEVS